MSKPEKTPESPIAPEEEFIQPEPAALLETDLEKVSGGHIHSAAGYYGCAGAPKKV